ncbi:threonine aldolase, partial [Vibrio sp. 10N.261.45.F1]
MSTDLRQQCNLLLSGHFDPTPAQTFAQMAEWCEAPNVSHDS